MNRCLLHESKHRPSFPPVPQYLDHGIRQPGRPSSQTDETVGIQESLFGKIMLKRDIKISFVSVPQCQMTVTVKEISFLVKLKNLCPVLKNRITDAFSGIS
jgi:hypothetical protein